MKVDRAPSTADRFFQQEEVARRQDLLFRMHAGKTAAQCRLDGLEVEASVPDDATLVFLTHDSFTFRKVDPYDCRGWPLLKDMASEDPAQYVADPLDSRPVQG